MSLETAEPSGNTAAVLPEYRGHDFENSRSTDGDRETVKSEEKSGTMAVRALAKCQGCTTGLIVEGCKLRLHTLLHSEHRTSSNSNSRHENSLSISGSLCASTQGKQQFFPSFDHSHPTAKQNLSTHTHLRTCTNPLQPSPVSKGYRPPRWAWVRVVDRGRQTVPDAPKKVSFQEQTRRCQQKSLKSPRRIGTQ